MKIHHLNCGCMCPLGGAIFDGFSRGLTAHLVCHCLLIETEQGLVLIDTGFGLQDIQSPYSRLSSFFINFNRIQFARQYTAVDGCTTTMHSWVTSLSVDDGGRSPG